MISILSRREVGGDLSVSAPALSSAQIRLDAAMSQLSDSQTENFSGVVALVLGGGIGRALGSGVFAWASRRGSAILAEGLYQGVSLGSEVLAYRSFTQGLSSLSDTKGLATDLLSFGVLRGVGRLAQSQNVLLAHTLQAGGMVGAHHLAYGMGLATAPQGTTFEQFLEAERMNVVQIASLSLLHSVSGGRLLQVERSLDLEREVLSSSKMHIQPGPQVLPSPSLVMRSTQERVSIDTSLAMRNMQLERYHDLVTERLAENRDQRVSESNPRKIKFLIEEEAYLNSLKPQTLTEVLDVLLAADQFYTVTRFMIGGTKMKRAFSTLQADLLQYVAQSRLYRERLFRAEEGHYYFNQFESRSFPPLIALNDGWNAPEVIRVGDAELGLDCLAYFRIDALRPAQEIVSAKKVENYKLELADPSGLQRPIHIGFHKRMGQFYILDGHHRALSAGLNGHTYILGKYKGALGGPMQLYQWAELDFISHEAFLAIAADRGFGEGLNYNNLPYDN